MPTASRLRNLTRGDHALSSVRGRLGLAGRDGGVGAWGRRPWSRGGGRAVLRPGPDEHSQTGVRRRVCLGGVPCGCDSGPRRTRRRPREALGKRRLRPNALCRSSRGAEGGDAARPEQLFSHSQGAGPDPHAPRAAAACPVSSGMRHRPLVDSRPHSPCSLVRTQSHAMAPGG